MQLHRVLMPSIREVCEERITQMKSLISTLLLNLGLGEKSASLDEVSQHSELKDEVNASTPSCMPTV